VLKDEFAEIAFYILLAQHFAESFLLACELGILHHLYKPITQIGGKITLLQKNVRLLRHVKGHSDLESLYLLKRGFLQIDSYRVLPIFGQ